MSIPEDFGRIGGTPISNKDTILDEIDTTIDRKRPKVEYIVCLPYTQFKIPFLGWGACYNFYGHSAVRYQLPQGDGTYKDTIMNVEAKQEPNLNNMLKFYDTSDYLFEMDTPIGGIYTRSILTVGYDDVPDENILKMHEYYESIHEKSLTGHTQFDIVLGPIWNIFSRIFPVLSERGNCTKWTSEGLKKADIIDTTHIWPKNLWITMFENHDQKVKPTVVLYQQVQHCPNKYGLNGGDIGSYTAPFDWVRSISYRNPSKFADCVVSVPDNTCKAVIEVNPEPEKPNQIRNTMNSNAFIGVSVVACGFISYKAGKRGIGLMRRFMHNRQQKSNTTFKERTFDEFIEKK
jgi:hypothetical protein